MLLGIEVANLMLKRWTSTLGQGTDESRCEWPCARGTVPVTGRVYLADLHSVANRHQGEAEHVASERAEPVMVLPPQIERNFEGRRAVYLNLKDWINLARVVKGLSAPAGYPELLQAAQRAVRTGTALFPLSATHYMEMSGIADPAQQRDIAAVMDELSEFRVLLGRPSIMQLEIEAALDRMQSLPSPVNTLALQGRSVGWAYGRRGGLRVGYDGRDVTAEFEDQPWYQRMLRAFERRMLEGLSDAEDALLRLTNSDYQPEFVQQFSEQRARQEREQAARLDAAPRWRRGRLRDVVSARELALE